MVSGTIHSAEFLVAAIMDGASWQGIKAAGGISPAALEKRLSSPYSEYVPAMERAKVETAEANGEEYEPNARTIKTEYDPIHSAIDAGWNVEDLSEMIAKNPKKLLPGHLNKLASLWKDKPIDALDIAKLNPDSIDNIVLSTAIHEWNDLPYSVVIALAMVDKKGANHSVSYSSVKVAIDHWMGEDVELEVGVVKVGQLIAMNPTASLVKQLVDTIPDNQSVFAAKVFSELMQVAKAVADKKDLQLDEGGFISSSQPDISESKTR